MCEHNNATIAKLHSKQISAEQLVSEPIPLSEGYFYHSLNEYNSNNVTDESGNKEYTIVNSDSISTSNTNTKSNPIINTIITLTESRAFYTALMDAHYLWPATGGGVALGLLFIYLLRVTK